MFFLSDVQGDEGLPSQSIESEVAAADIVVKLDFAKPFQFLNLGVLAYLGASEALAQVGVGWVRERETHARMI